MSLTFSRGANAPQRRRTASDLFCWLAGAHLRTLDRYPTERGFYAALGMALAIPFILGTVGATVVLHVVTGRPAVDPLLVAVGVGWGVLVVIADRLVLSVRSASGSRVMFTLLRVGFAVGTAVVVTEPLLATWFGPEAIREARRELGEEKVAEVTRIKADYDGRRSTLTAASAPRQEQLKAEVGRLQSEVDAARSIFTERQRVCDAETNGGRGPRGFGPEATVLCAAADRAHDDLTRTESATSGRIAEVQGELGGLGGPLDELSKQEAAELEQVQSKSVDLADLGLWRRIELTHRVVAWWWLLALTGTLVILDTLPVLIKALRGRTMHDEMLAAVSQRSATSIATETEDHADASKHDLRQKELDRESEAEVRAAQRAALTLEGIRNAQAWAEARPAFVDRMPSRIDDTTEEFPSASANGHRPAGHQGRGGAIALSLVVALLAAGLVAAVEGAGDGGGNRPVSVSAARSTVLPLRGGGRVIVPAGAMVDGTKISAGYEGSPGGDIPDARPSGSPVELLADSSDAFKGLVTLELPVASDMASGDVGIATFNEKTRSWVPVPSTFNAARGLVTAQIPHFSWYEPWTWDFASVGARVNQRIGQIVGKRSEAPKCTRGQPVPGWVTSVAGVTTDAAIAIRACTEGEGDVLAVELTNNRPYGMVMTYGSSVKWGWHEPGDSALDRARNKFVDVIIPANQLYLPPGGRASVGIPRVEGGPLNFHIGLTRLAFLADATASIAGEVIGNLNGAACAGWILGGDIGNLASPGAVRDLIKEVEPCVTESLKAAGTAGALDGQTIAKIESTFKTLGKASVIGRILKAYDVEWHLADIWVDTKIVGGVPGLGSGFAVLGRRESAPVTPAGPSAAPAGPAAPRTPATPAATTTTTGTPKTATTAAPNATTTVAPSTTTAAPPTTSTTAMTAPTTTTTTPKTCQSFTVYAQNRWDPQGASLRVAPDHNSQRLGGFAGNTPLIVNGWTYGSRPYPANPVPYESAIWFRLANGSGWVSFPGVRAEPTTYAPNSDDGGPAAPTPSECQV